MVYGPDPSRRRQMAEQLQLVHRKKSLSAIQDRDANEGINEGVKEKEEKKGINCDGLSFRKAEKLHSRCIVTARILEYRLGPRRVPPQHGRRVVHVSVDQQPAAFVRIVLLQLVV